MSQPTNPKTMLALLISEVAACLSYFANIRFTQLYLSNHVSLL